MIVLSVNSLTLCPQDDHFLSAAADGTVRLWDLRSKQCEGMLLATGRPCVAYDSAGLIFAVTSDSGTVRLFDPRSYQKGPFESFALKDDKAEWTKLEFSPDGQRLMLSAASNLVVILDAFRGDEVGIPTVRIIPVDSLWFAVAIVYEACQCSWVGIG